MTKKIQKNRKAIFGFFALYLILMGAGIYWITSYFDDRKLNDQPIEMSAKFKQEIDEELKVYEAKRKLEEIKNAGKWKPSNTFFITALTAATILDIVLILLWARHEIRTREVRVSGATRNRWRDNKWFWNIVGMGNIQEKGGRLEVG
ncbi:hypothetical protein [Mesobacillus harenae]|uniref:hypothetical protein n=1 Tax=Mesobacillus harenae TaxID=2213203 RepID=UPI001580EF50|nr:hypothetical protein [Mesobacillus harenae]